MIEIVQPFNHQREDRVVFTVILIVLFFAAVLMSWLYPWQDSVDNGPPKVLLHTLTTLGNAADEMLMLSELERDIPSLDELRQQGVSPFDGGELVTSNKSNWAQHAECFLGFVDADGGDQFQLRLMFSGQSAAPAYEMSWRRIGVRTDSGVANTVSACEGGTNEGWKVVQNLNTSNHNNHAH
ncbi:MAG: hypothetical protein AAF434_03165 [Pseudomonadota bacterium]